MAKCEMCGRTTTKLYQVPFGEEDGVTAVYNICSECVPRECVDYINEEDNQQVMQNMMARR